MSEQPPSKPRVVVTGMGALTPLGIGVEESWQALCRGESGIRNVTGFDASNLRTQVAGQVRDFRPGDFMDKRHETRFDRFITQALAASRMAVWDSKLEITPGIADRIGVVIGNSPGGMIRLEEDFQRCSSFSRQEPETPLAVVLRLNPWSSRKPSSDRM